VRGQLKLVTYFPDCKQRLLPRPDMKSPSPWTLEESGYIDWGTQLRRSEPKHLEEHESRKPSIKAAERRRRGFARPLPNGSSLSRPCARSAERRVGCQSRCSRRAALGPHPDLGRGRTDSQMHGVGPKEAKGSYTTRPAGNCNSAGRTWVNIRCRSVNLARTKQGIQ